MCLLPQECKNKALAEIIDNYTCACVQNTIINDTNCICDDSKHFISKDNKTCICDSQNNFVDDGKGGC